MIGPVFTRELTLAPRREATYLLRAIYAGVLIVLVATSWLVISGTQLITDPGDFARFGGMLFQFLAPIQLVLAVFLSATLVASAIGREKDRQTFLLLLLTRMSNSELVLGKLLASLLSVLLMIAVSLPIFMLLSMLGGISYPQIVRVLIVTFLSALVSGSLGSCMALWRDKTFPAIATTLLIIFLWIAFWEGVGLGLFNSLFCNTFSSSPWILPKNIPSLCSWFSPWNAILIATRPAADVVSDSSWISAASELFAPIQGFLCCSGIILILLNVFAIAMVRVWNPSREIRLAAPEDDTWKQKTPTHLIENKRENKGKQRTPWNNPILWREIMTRAYGRRLWIIQFGFFAFFAMTVLAIRGILTEHVAISAVDLAGTLIPLFLLSLILVNVQAITSQTSEKDGGTFDLILVSDVTPKEYVFGKLGGIFYNMKAIVILPLCLCWYLHWERAFNATSLFFLFVSLIVMYTFVAMIGVYIGMQYDKTRMATATSLGIVFFLFVGIAACIWIMVAFGGSFETQLIPFAAFMVGGGIGLYLILGARNPSTAIAISSFILPIAVFYMITSMLLGAFHLVFIVLVGAFGFTIAAMLIPLLAEFDLATGRTSGD
ncbi:MAG: ABC transporter permease subunit [Thermoguttaceae bacterium]